MSSGGGAGGGGDGGGVGGVVLCDVTTWREKETDGAD